LSSPVSNAELNAAKALALPAFRRLNLAGVRDAVAKILGLIGRDGLFRDYTLHDISHVDEMLAVLDWLIPAPTRNALSPADWLLIVLSVYFHDAGLVVTKQEFAARAESGFPRFRDTELYAGPDGTEYRSKVGALDPDDAERFLYEEFVRSNHADRIADWIGGGACRLLGVSAALANEVASVLSPLPAEFRRDLALVCRSHHLADLHDTRKYKISQPYGNSDAETANVHYAALLLRTADLLHITADRTPSLMFRLINPRDPVSQREWAKQHAVRRVRPQKGRDRDGNFSDSASQDTIEVFATFTEPEGFFGLTSYLRYAERQLVQTYDWAAAAARDHDLPYAFPWRRIDDGEVTATGFLPEQLSFSLDEARILELLTGHTLYNETAVVIRELVQNALDASRLQALIDERAPETSNVCVSWDTAARLLTITDDGTGMSQSVIERNLLRAGASRYQEESFRRLHPTFSPISRFGIGVLSAFMIADWVEITTCSPDDDQARQLTLRSVHGRYLVELLDKESDPRALALMPHGTQVRLRVRVSAELPGVINRLKRWIVVPQCSVVARINDGEPVQIGHSTLSDALRDIVKQLGHQLATGDLPEPDAVRIVERRVGDVATAVALRWDPFFREWSFVMLRDSAPASLRLGTCVEGVRVEDSTPGFDSRGILAMCNALGPTAPKTNVARSGLEATPERVELLRRVYGAYFEHVAVECQELSNSRGMSVTWAGQEAQALLAPLLSLEDPTGRRLGVHPLDARVFDEESRRYPFVLTEAEGTRVLRSGDMLSSEPVIWTVDSGFVRAAERLLREIPSKASLTSLATGFATETFKLPEEPTLVGFEGRASCSRLVSWTSARSGGSLCGQISAGSIWRGCRVPTCRAGSCLVGSPRVMPHRYVTHTVPQMCSSREVTLRLTASETRSGCRHTGFSICWRVVRLRPI